MYKNLSPTALGVSGRQSELIELALTYGFRGVEIDMADFLRRARSSGADQAGRFLNSAKLKIGSFELPVNWQAEEAAYRKDLALLPQIVETVATLDAGRCYTTVLPGSDELPYHENFERARKRLAEIADILAAHQMRLGLGFLALSRYRKDHDYQFIHQAEALLTLLKTISAKNVGLALDTWNWRLGGGATDQLDELSGEQIVTVRLADGPPDVDWSEMTEKQRLLPGTGGLVDNGAIVRLLAAKQYEGPVTLAPHPSCLSGMTRDNIVQRASQILDELFAAAGVGRPAKPAPVTTES
ncbi:MAG: sugar phosphate isomerase/epimerase [Pirellulaceae bacterium]|nr:sugar phosphate isomerase/epimerase [Pirellulaceae bacterium]